MYSGLQAVFARSSGHPKNQQSHQIFDSGTKRKQNEPLKKCRFAMSKPQLRVKMVWQRVSKDIAALLLLHLVAAPPRFGFLS